MQRRGLQSGHLSRAKGRCREVISARVANFRVCVGSCFGTRLAEARDGDDLFIVASS